ncbi:MAG: hypothetical protein U9N35_08650 [Euryarchaeota archaeon]|nr:hypothetical protein [Euryarchaeota archaeon]
MGTNKRIVFHVPSGKNGRAGYQEIDAVVQVETDVSKEELEKWIEEVEKRCPVADNISESTPLSVSVTKK